MDIPKGNKLSSPPPKDMRFGVRDPADDLGRTRAGDAELPADPGREDNPPSLVADWGRRCLACWNSLRSLLLAAAEGDRVSCIQGGSTASRIH